MKKYKKVQLEPKQGRAEDQKFEIIKLFWSFEAFYQKTITNQIEFEMSTRFLLLVIFKRSDTCDYQRVIQVYKCFIPGW